MSSANRRNQSNRAAWGTKELTGMRHECKANRRCNLSSSTTPYAFGFCPNCGVRYNGQEASIGTAMVADVVWIVAFHPCGTDNRRRWSKDGRA